MVKVSLLRYILISGFGLPKSFRNIIDFVIDFLPMFMFVSLALLLFTGYPVAFILGGLALLYGFIGYALGIFSIIEFFNFFTVYTWMSIYKLVNLESISNNFFIKIEFKFKRPNASVS